MSAHRVRARVVAAFACAALGRVRAQEVPADRAAIADAVRTDLSRLATLERAYFAANRRYTADFNALRFTPRSGARIAVSYASARTFSASAADARLAPYLCFVIASEPTDSGPTDKPFCTDSRLGTAASALAAEAAPPPVPPAPVKLVPAPAPAPARASAPAPAVASPAESAADAALTTVQFADRLGRAVALARDSEVIVVSIDVKDARYDPSREVLELSLDRVPLPLVRSGAAEPPRLAITCFARPAFLCGADGLTYVARDIWHIPRSRAPDADVLRSGLTVRAEFSVGRRDDVRGTALTLLGLVLRRRGEVLARWEPPGVR